MSRLLYFGDAPSPILFELCTHKPDLPEQGSRPTTYSCRRFLNKDAVCYKICPATLNKYNPSPCAVDLALLLGTLVLLPRLLFADFLTQEC